MGDWRAGYAQRDITPRRGHTLMGGFGYERYAQGTIAPLRAQALALADGRGAGSAKVLLLAADVLGFDRVFVEAIRRSLGRRHGLRPQAILLAASHTHWGPAISYRVVFNVGAPDLWYRHGLERVLLELADEAMASLRPATLEYSALPTRIGHNRRQPGANGKVGWGPHPDGEYDEHTPVLRIRRCGDPASLLLVTHACHPTSTGRTARWSPDYPGALRDRLEQALGRGTRCLFAMGCGGDAKVCHRDAAGQWVFSASPAQSRAAGRRLAGAVLDHLAAATPTVLHTPLTCRLASGWLTFAASVSPRRLDQMAFEADELTQNAAWARQMLAYPDTRRRYRYEAQAWRFGDALTLLALEGEVCSPLGPLARSLAATPNAMLAAYANATDAYIPSAALVSEGGYEGESSHRAYFLPAPFTQRVEAQFTRIVARAAGRKTTAS